MDEEKQFPVTHAPVWARSSYCADGACVEVALLDGDRVGLRDAKAPDRLPIVFASGDWDLFLADVRSGHYQDI